MISCLFYFIFLKIFLYTFLCKNSISHCEPFYPRILWYIYILWRRFWKNIKISPLEIVLGLFVANFNPLHLMMRCVQFKWNWFWKRGRQCKKVHRQTGGLTDSLHTLDKRWSEKLSWAFSSKVYLPIIWSKFWKGSYVFTDLVISTYLLSGMLFCACFT